MYLLSVIYLASEIDLSCGDFFLNLFEMMLGFPCDEAGSNHIIEML